MPKIIYLKGKPSDLRHHRAGASADKTDKIDQ